MMKTFLFLFILMILQFGFAKELTLAEKADRASLSIRLANYARQTPKNLRYTILSDLHTFGNLDLDEKQDFPLVKNALSTLLLMDKMDLPRSGAQNLADSYGRHKAIYKKAAASIETAENKKLLNELLKMMEEFDQNGNG